MNKHQLLWTTYIVLTYSGFVITAEIDVNDIPVFDSIDNSTDNEEYNSLSVEEKRFYESGTEESVENNELVTLPDGHNHTNYTGSGELVLDGDVVNEADLIENSLLINKDQSFASDASAIKGVVKNGGSLILTGGVLCSPIENIGQLKHGVTYINGYVSAEASISNNIMVYMNQSLEIDADNLNNLVQNEGFLYFTGGTITKTISGQGTVCIAGNVVSDVVITNELRILPGAVLTIPMNKIKNKVLNEGTLIITSSGTIENDILGDGSLVIKNGTVTNKATVENKIEIKVEQSFISNADTATNAIYNEGIYRVEGGTITSPITGIGILRINGEVNSKSLINNEIIINSNNTFEAGANLIKNKVVVERNANINILGGNIICEISGKGQLSTYNKVVNDSLITIKNIWVAKNSEFHSVPDSLAQGTLTNAGGTVYLSEGTLDRTIESYSASKNEETSSGKTVITGKILSNVKIKNNIEFKENGFLEYSDKKINSAAEDNEPEPVKSEVFINDVRAEKTEKSVISVLKNRTSYTSDFEINDVKYSSSNSREGGAIYVNSVNGDIRNSIFYQNKSNNKGGAIYVNGSKSIGLNIDNVVFDTNRSAKNMGGGALFVAANNSSDPVKIEITDSLFINNMAEGASKALGGAIAVSGYTDLNIKNSDFNSNASKGSAGALLIQDSSKTVITDSNFTSNHSDVAGGAINNTATLTINAENFDVNFTDNNSKQGGAINNSGRMVLNTKNNHSINFHKADYEGLSNDIYNTGTLKINGDVNVYSGISGTGSLNVLNGKKLSCENLIQEKISNHGEITISGTLNSKVEGNGTVKINDNLYLTENTNIDGILDLNEGSLDIRSGKNNASCSDFSVGTLKGSGNLSISLKKDSKGKIISDSLTVKSYGNGSYTVCVLDNMVNGELENFTVSVLNGYAGANLKIADEILQKYNFEETKQYEKVSQIKAHSKWEDTFGVERWSVKTVKTLEVDGGKIVYAKNLEESAHDVSSPGDAMAILNASDKFEDKSISTENADAVYNVASDIGVTANKILVKGAKDGNKLSAVDFDGNHTGFILENKDSIVNLTNIKFRNTKKEAGSVLNIKNSDSQANLSNVIIDNAILNSGKLNLSESNNLSDITGNGVLNILSGDSNVGVIEQNAVKISEGASLSPQKIKTEQNILNSGVLNFKSGTLYDEVLNDSSAIGTTVIDGNVTFNNKNANNIIINNNKLLKTDSANINNSNSVTNEGNLTLSGVLSNKIAGRGTTTVNKTLQLASSCNIDGCLDINNGTLILADGIGNNHKIGKLKGEGELFLNFIFENESSFDTITLDGSENCKLTISNLNIGDDLKKIDAQIFKGNTSELQLELSRNLIEQYNNTSDKYLVFDTDKLTENTKWSDKFVSKTYEAFTTEKLWLEDNNRLKYNFEETKTLINEESQGDTFSIVNQTDKFLERFLTTDDASYIYKLTQDIDITKKGVLTIQGAIDKNNISTVDMNFNRGFELEEDETTLNISNVKFINIGDNDGGVINISNPQSVSNLSDVIIEGNSSCIANDGILNISNSNISGNIIGQGNLTAKNGNISINSINQNYLNVQKEAVLNVNTILSDTINSGSLNISDGSISGTISGDGNISILGKVENYGTVSNNLSISENGDFISNSIQGVVNNKGKYTITGGTVAQSILGNGSLIVNGEIESAADIENAVEINSEGKLTVNAANLISSKDNIYTLNNGELVLTGGKLKKGIKGSGKTIIADSVTAVGNGIEQNILEIISEKVLSSNSKITINKNFINSGILQTSADIEFNCPELKNDGDIKQTGLGCVTTLNGDFINNGSISASNFTINNTGSLTTHTDNLNISGKLKNSGSLILTGGDISKNILCDDGTTVISGDVGVKAEINNKVQIKDGARLSSLVTSLKNSINNNGELILSTSSKNVLNTNDITGKGILKIDSSGVYALDNSANIENNIIIDAGKLMKSSADKIKGNVNINSDETNIGKWIVTGGLISSDVDGTGCLSIESEIDSTGIIKVGEINIEKDASFSSDANNIETKIITAENASYKVNGGTIKSEVRGSLNETSGNTVIDGNNVSLEADIYNSLIINSGSDLTAVTENIKNTVINNGNLSLAGTLDKLIGGSGTVDINESLVFDKGAEIQGTLNFNNGTLKLADNTVNEYSVGAIKGDGNLELNLNFNDAVFADSINAANSENGKITITNLNITGQLKNFEVEVIKGNTENIQLEISKELHNEYNKKSEKYTIVEADDLTPNTNWTDEFTTRTYEAYIKDTFNVQNNSVLKYNSEEIRTLICENSNGDTFTLINNSENFKNRSYTTNDANAVNKLSANIGKTSEGTFTVAGAISENAASTIDMNGYQGFELVNDGVILNLNNLKFINAGSVDGAIVNSSAVDSIVNLTNISILGANKTTAFYNDAILTVSGNTTLETSILGNGSLICNSNQDDFDNNKSLINIDTASQRDIRINGENTVLNIKNIQASGEIQNEGTLNLTEDFALNSKISGNGITKISANISNKKGNSISNKINISESSGILNSNASDILNSVIIEKGGVYNISDGKINASVLGSGKLNINGKVENTSAIEVEQISILNGSELSTKFKKTSDVNSSQKNGLCSNIITNNGILNILGGEIGRNSLETSSLIFNGTGETILSNELNVYQDVVIPNIEIKNDAQLNICNGKFEDNIKVYGKLTVNESFVNKGIIDTNYSQPEESKYKQFSVPNIPEIIDIQADKSINDGQIIGSGGVKISGNLSNNGKILTSGGVTIDSKGSLKTLADLIKSDIKNNNNYTLTGGTIENHISGNGVTTIDGDVVNNGSVYQSILINESKSFLSNADRLMGNIDNNGSFTVTGGKISQDITGIGTIFIKEDALNEAVIKNTIEIYSGKKFTTNAQNIENNVINNGIYNLTEGEINNIISGDGIINISGDIISNSNISQNIDIENGCRFTADAGKISGKITNAGTLIYNGGDILQPVLGNGLIEIIGDVYNKVEITQPVNINSGSLTSDASYLKNTVNNYSKLNLSGCLTNTIMGSGTTNIINELKLENNSEVQGTLNLNNGILNLKNDKVCEHYVNKLSGNGEIKINVDCRSNNIISDVIKAEACDAGEIILSDINIIGSSDKFSVKVLDIKNGANNTKLKVADSLKRNVEISPAERVEDIVPEVEWSKKFIAARGEIEAVSTFETEGADILKFQRVETFNKKDEYVIGDTMSMLNRAADLGAGNVRSIKTNNSKEIYTLEDNLGLTAQGSFSVVGASDGNNKSILDMNKNSGFIVDNDNTLLNISDVSIINPAEGKGSIIDIDSENATLKLSNINIEYKSKDAVEQYNENQFIYNNGFAQLYGTNILDTGIYGTGRISIESGETTLDSIHQKVLEIKSEATLNINADTCKITERITNSGNLIMTGGTNKLNLGGRGSLIVDGSLENTALINNNVIVKSGILTTQADDIDGEITNNAELNLSGLLTKPVSGKGITNIDGTLVFTDGASIEGTLNLNNANLKLNSSKVSDYNVGILKGDGNLKLNLDFTSSSARIDSITAQKSEKGSILINELNIEGPKEYFELQVLKGDTSNITLLLSEEVKSMFYSQSDSVEKINDDLIADIDWSEKFTEKEYRTTKMTEVNVVDNSILKYDTVWARELLAEKPNGDTIALLNQTDLFSIKSATTNDAKAVYNVESDFGKTSGSLTVSGKKDAESISKINFGSKYKGYVLSDNDTALTLSNLEIVNAIDEDGSIINISNKINTSVDIANVVINAEDINSIYNDGEINLYGNNIIKTCIKGAGKLNLSGGNTTISKVMQDEINIIAGSLSVKASGILSANGVKNDSILELSDGKILNNITGNGLVIINGDVENTASVNSKNVTINKDCCLKTHADSIKTDKYFKNYGTYIVTGGTMTSAIIGGNTKETFGDIIIEGDVLSNFNMGNIVTVEKDACLTTSAIYLKKETFNKGTIVLNGGQILNEILEDGKVVINATVSNASLVENDVTINGGKLLFSAYNDDIKGTVFVEKNALYKIQGSAVGKEMNTKAIKGAGTTYISGKIVNKSTKISTDLNITGHFTTNADLIDNDVLNKGTYNLIGGNIKYDIKGIGTTIINGDVVNNAVIENTVEIQNGSISCDAGSLLGNIKNDSVLNISGTLDKIISGKGTTNINGSLIMASGASISGKLNLNNGHLSLTGKKPLNVGTISGNGSISLNIDFSSGRPVIDTINASVYEQGVIIIKQINVSGILAPFELKVLKGNTSNIILKIDEALQKAFISETDVSSFDSNKKLRRLIVVDNNTLKYEESIIESEKLDAVAHE